MSNRCKVSSTPGSIAAYAASWLTLWSCAHNAKRQLVHSLQEASGLAIEWLLMEGHIPMQSYGGCCHVRQGPALSNHPCNLDSDVPRLSGGTQSQDVVVLWNEQRCCYGTNKSAFPRGLALQPPEKLVSNTRMRVRSVPCSAGVPEPLSRSMEMTSEAVLSQTRPQSGAPFLWKAVPAGERRSKESPPNLYRMVLAAIHLRIRLRPCCAACAPCVDQGVRREADLLRVLWRPGSWYWYSVLFTLGADLS